MIPDWAGGPSGPLGVPGLLLQCWPIFFGLLARLVTPAWAPQLPLVRFFARLCHFGVRTCPSRAPRDVPGLDFRARNDCFFEVFASDERSTRKTSDIDKTLAGAIRNALRSCRAVVENVHKSIRKRFRLRWAMRRALTGVLGVVPNALGAFPKRSQAAIGRFLAALDAPGVPQDRL